MLTDTKFQQRKLGDDSGLSEPWKHSFTSGNVIALPTNMTLLKGHVSYSANSLACGDHVAAVALRISKKKRVAFLAT
jgi:hypothetical protein